MTNGSFLKINLQEPTIQDKVYRRRLSIEELLIMATEEDCSDLYIKVGERPYVSRYGKIIELPCFVTSKDDWSIFYDKYVKNELNAHYVRKKLLDISVSVRVPEDSPNYGDKLFYRYRASFGYSEEANICTFRMIRPEKPTFDNITYPKQVVEALKVAMARPTGIVVFSGATGSGKALHKSTLIPTPDGMIKLGDLDVGDIVFSKDGTETEITGKYNPESEKFYEFIFSDGTKVKTAEDHLWEIEIWSQTATLTTQEIVERYSDHKHCVNIKRPEAVQYKEKQLNIDPYEYGKQLNNKIPFEYKYNTVENRVELLKGVVETYGRVFKNRHTITLDNLDIIKDIREVCCSLGYKCKDIKKFGVKYKLTFYPTLEHKMDVKNNFVLEDIIEIDGKNEDYYCISVDHPSKIFLCTESYLPTHNSTSQSACINTFTQEGDILDNKVIITIEDPIEQEYDSTKSVKITQKELGVDVTSFDNGVYQALREHPNMIIVGECRNREVITAAINASRTGHQVTTSFHASNVGGTISRMLFYLDNDKNLSFDLLMNLNMIVSQRLIKSDDRYIVDTQYLLITDNIRSLLIDIAQSDQNIAIEVDKLVKDSNLLEAGVSKDWDYKEV